MPPGLGVLCVGWPSIISVTTANSTSTLRCRCLSISSGKRPAPVEPVPSSSLICHHRRSCSACATSSRHYHFPAHSWLFGCFDYSLFPLFFPFSLAVSLHPRLLLLLGYLFPLLQSWAYPPAPPGVRVSLSIRSRPLSSSYPVRFVSSEDDSWFQKSILRLATENFTDDQASLLVVNDYYMDFMRWFLHAHFLYAGQQTRVYTYALTI